MSLPKWKSHKVIEAAPIETIIRGDGRGAVLELAGVDEPITVDQAYMDKHEPQEGGYYVRYPDGYESWSPAEAFEEGYTLVPKPAPANPGAGARTGRVKWYNPDKGFGFIVPDDGGRDVFCHASAVREAGLTTLAVDQGVTFTEVEGAKGPAVGALVA